MSVYAYQALSSLGLRDQHLLEMLPSVDMVALAPGQAPRDGFGGAFWHVMEGLVCATSVHSPSAVPDVLDFYGPGSWFGEGGLMALPHFESASFDNLTAVRLMRVPMAQASAAFHRDFEFAQFIARMALWRCRLRAEMLTLVKAAKPAPRVMLSLALMAEALLSSSSHLPSASVGTELHIPIKQAVLASFTGLSRAVLSLQLQPLGAAGWLRLDYGSLCLFNLPGWRALLETHRQNDLQRLLMHELLALAGTP